MKVKDLMVEDVITASPHTSVREIARMMADNRVGSVMIVEDEKLKGIITDRDILLAFAEGGGADFDEMKVEDVMTKYVFDVSQNANVKEAVDLMMEHKIKKLPVTSRGKLVGIITSSDIAASQSGITDNVGKLISKKLKGLVDKD